MRKTLVVLVAIILIGSINTYAAFPTFVWTKEYRSELYAVEMAADDISAALVDEEIIVFDIAEDELATPTDIKDKEPIPDERMSIAGDEEDPASAAQSITSYDVEFEVVEDGMEPVEALEEDIEPAKDTQEEEQNTEPKEED